MSGLTRVFQSTGLRLLAEGGKYLVYFYLMSVALVTAPASAQAPWTGPGVGLESQAPPAAEAVPSVGLTVSDMERSLAFYSGVLPFVVESDTEVAGREWEDLTGIFGVRMRLVRLRLGSEHLELTEYIAASMPGRPAPVDSRSNDRWFQHVAIIVSDMDSAYALLRGRRVRSASTSPQLLPKSIPGAAGIRAFYFRDPDGHPLEILQFPPDKGDPRWQQKDALFLGIDHTAIVVASTARSLAFYRDLLGFKVAGESRNQGTEQEHLNNVEGARLHITGLRSGAGPGVELLDYVAPSNGRPIPDDQHPNDLAHWHTTIRIRSLADLGPRLDAAGVARVSRNSGNALGVFVKDPDGHVVQLIER